MKRRVANLFLMTTIAFGFFAADAVAQDKKKDDMSFGVDEVDEVNKDSPVAEFIKEGKALYAKKKYTEASLLFFKVLQTKDAAAEGYHPEAQYELGKTLFRMKLYQGALSYFGRVVDAGDTHPYYNQVLRGLVMLSDAIPEDPTLLSRLEAYAGNFQKNVPRRYKQQFAYLVGRYYYANGDFDKAQAMLNRVRPGYKDFVKARYIMGVNNVATYKAKKAVRNFKEVLRVLLSKQEKGPLTADEQALLDKTYLAMARVFYSTGTYNSSIKYFSKIPRKSPLWAKSLFESSWAYFQIDKYNKALGNLHSLSSPFFSKSYFPEANILSAVLFFYNCKYPRVKYVLEEFEYNYLPLKDEIAGVLKKNEDSSAMFKWLNQLRQGKAEEDEKLARVLAASLDDKEVLRKLSLIDAISKEEQQLKAMPSTWRTSELGAALAQDTIVAKELAINDTGELVKTRLDRVKRTLEDLSLKRERILFEVSRAEQGELEADWRAEMVVKKNITDKAKIKVSDEQLYWTFDGEYWKDELGYYIFNINTECKR